MPDTSRLPKILIVATVHWPATTRLGLALAESGFAVGAVTPAHHGLRRLDSLAASFVCQPHFGLTGAVAAAIEQWSPDLVVPGDDRALATLHRLHARALQWRGQAPRRMKALIEASLGDPRHFDIVAKKSEFVRLAKAEGLTVPQTVVVQSLADLRRHLAHAKFPQVLKVDGSWGGLGVRIVRSAREAEEVFTDFALPPPWRRVGKQILQHANFTPLADRLRGRQPTVTLQSYIEGRPANRAVACWQGEVLAGLSVEVVETSFDTGPASVVRIIDHPEIADMTARLVRRLGISGFCGVDVILDRDGHAHLLELNARSTQACHLAFDPSSDMIGAIHAKLTRTIPRRIETRRHEVIAFFPQEMWRDPKSRHLANAYHDVPWGETELIDFYQQPDPPGWVDQLRHALRRRARPAEPAAALGIDLAKRES